ncbi:glycoside hydrolase family 3 C-terminal domain-containing protein [Lactiplantibacillus plantarum]|uniref:glycoside hydrolase family 3 C-terminal domain-containing protein n=1 Tax=Lactiplantibacillus plantarum TaxID=1590 RepID=UPI003F53091D
MKSKFDLTFVQKLTIQERAELVSGKNFWFTAENKDQQIPKLMMTDGPSGLRKQASSADALGLNQSVEAICFPSAALTASSFNVALLYNLGKKLGTAARAEDVDVLLGPGVNIKRSPLAGRNFEYFSEDPYLAGELGSAYVKGVQQEGVGVSVKHFAANNRENQRFTSSSNIDERALREIYLTAFEKIVKQAQPATLMCSYNAINGVLNSQNYRLLTQILRNEWGFEGLVMSDWGAVADNIAALRAGLDLEMPGNGDYSVQEIIKAVHTGELEEAQLNTSALRVLEMVEKFHINAKASDNYDKDDQHAFAKKAAEDGMVLLKNDHAVLPLKPTDKIAIIGALAQTPRYQGGGSSHVNAYKLVSPLKAAQNSANHISFAQGYALDSEKPDQMLASEAVSLAKSNDKVVFFAGVPEQFESEGFDKQSMDLPDNQIQLIHEVAESNPNLIVVLQNGSAVSMPWQGDTQAILETYLAGEAVGEATWAILTGATNPSGKLAETFPERIEDTPAFGTFNASPDEENYYEGIYVGYRYYDVKKQEVNYPFGFGLSYTTFKYDDLKVSVKDSAVNVTVKVTNTGDVYGKETVQVYVQNLASTVETPIQELKAFRKVDLQAGESQTLTMTLDRRSFAWYDAHTANWRVDNGEYRIKAASSSRDKGLSEIINVDFGSEVKTEISDNTYLSEIINRADLQEALKQTGLQKMLNSIVSGSNSELMANMPLRAIIMLGASIDQMYTFLKLANE